MKVGSKGPTKIGNKVEVDYGTKKYIETDKKTHRRQISFRNKMLQMAIKEVT